MSKIIKIILPIMLIEAIRMDGAAGAPNKEELAQQLLNAGAAMAPPSE